ncbi:hypothetical protein FSP39_020438 [Pinctada imbricata]|uniref:Uncharacterized protein n=1 Tax=Pinctada imbricata TaxID=66713 RepID=A0AA88YEQ5_PINIB|nr:hypothetical protein FSP39_020438 [Pinctada imbricata]
MEVLGVVLHLDEVEEDHHDLLSIYYKGLDIVMDETEISQVINVDTVSPEENHCEGGNTDLMSLMDSNSHNKDKNVLIQKCDDVFDVGSSLSEVQNGRQSVSTDSEASSNTGCLEHRSRPSNLTFEKGSDLQTVDGLLRSKAPKPSSPSSAFLPPCRVCSDPASGFHYGVNTCEACKGFFRRSIIKVQQKNQAYKCKAKLKEEKGSCILGPGKKNVCGSCRYQKCLDVGMSQDAIKTGRYTYEKRTKDTVEVKRLLANDGRVIDEMIGEDEIDSILYSLNNVQLNYPDMHLLQNNEFIKQKQMKIYTDHQAKVETFGSMSVIPKQVWEEFFERTGIDLDDRQQVMKGMAEKMEVAITNMVDYVRTIPGFTELTVADQTALVKTSHFEYWYVGNYQFIDPDLRVITGQSDFHESNVQSIIRQDFLDAVFKFTKSMLALDLNPEEIILLRGIVVTFTDRCPLEGPEKVERIQWKLISGIYLVARRNKQNPNKRICKILDRLTELRCLTEMSRELDKEKLKWPIIKDYPLVMDVISV